MKVLLVAPPRVLWPYLNEQDNYLLPQPLVTLAAVLRRDGVDVRVIDCMPEQMGWRTLGKRIETWEPDVVAAGENHALFASEVVRLMALAKSIDRDVVTVVGGSHFTNTVPYYLPGDPHIDVIVRGEGEITFSELVRALDESGLEAVRQSELPGLAFVRDGEVHITPPRPLIEDLDSLPMPAFDLVPMDRYGSARYLFSPGGTTIHHGRGCPGRCRFCVWWRQMAKRRVDACGHEEVLPSWRTKSVERTVEEMSELYVRYDKRCLVFVDPTFNIDPRWSEEFAEGVLAKDWRDLRWFAFMRSDYILRDDRLGIFDKLVRSGLAHLLVGVERIEQDELDDWDKGFASTSEHVEVFGMLKDRYPHVFRQASFMVGTREETPASMRAQFDFARRLDVDFPSFHPVTPFPGTPLYDDAVEQGLLEVTDFDRFDLMTAVMPTRHMSCHEVEMELARLNKQYIGPRWLLRGLLSRSGYRRDMYMWWLTVTARVFAESLRQRLNPLDADRYTSPYTPDWYDQ